MNNININRIVEMVNVGLLEVQRIQTKGDLTPEEQRFCQETIKNLTKAVDEALLSKPNEKALVEVKNLLSQKMRPLESSIEMATKGVFSRQREEEKEKVFSLDPKKILEEAEQWVNQYKDAASSQQKKDVRSKANAWAQSALASLEKMEKTDQSEILKMQNKRGEYDPQTPEETRLKNKVYKIQQAMNYLTQTLPYELKKEEELLW